MGPLSARLLIQRGRPKSDWLGKIRSLDLSGLKLLSEHLDPKLLSRLKQLQELDLSNNQLETLPTNLVLSHLRILHCANNQLGDVTALCQFPQLEELSLEGNPFLTVSDNLKVSFLLPKLRKVNGKDASSTCSQVENLNRELTIRWSLTELAYFSLSTCPDEGTVLCGDEEGNVWLYDVRHILAQQPLLLAAPQPPMQILKWPQPQALGQAVTRTMVNMVVANSTFTYLTALTDSNIVTIWRRNQP
ncbi:hypothetical protein CB1_000724011 [Camelus ferus]|nr:hypothetical protein CB1_000724011 [Camelus ferus]